MWKDHDVGKDWRQEKGTTEDEMAGWRHRPDGLEFEWTPGVGDGQGGLVSAIHGVAKNLTRLSDWTELNLFSWATDSLNPGFVSFTFVWSWNVLNGRCLTLFCCRNSSSKEANPLSPYPSAQCQALGWTHWSDCTLASGIYKQVHSLSHSNILKCIYINTICQIIYIHIL